MWKSVKMLLNTIFWSVFFLAFVEIDAIENETCEFIVRMYGREVKPIRLPENHKERRLETVCKWTVMADKDRRVIFVCPFTPNRIEDKQCRSAFRVTPQEGTEICAQQGFTRVASNHRMIIHYKNTNSPKGDDFTCYAYGELRTTWNKPENITKPEKYLNHIFLRKNLGIHLSSTVLPKNHSSGVIVRWTVVAPAQHAIFLNCPFTNKPPYPTTNQIAPCHGTFKILAQDRNGTYPCSQHRSFSVTTTSDWLMLQFQNNKIAPDDHFECFLNTQLIYPPPPQSEISGAEFQHCDHILKLASGQIAELKSPTHAVFDDPKGFHKCRWTLIAPPDNHIALRIQGGLYLQATTGNQPNSWSNQSFFFTEGHCIGNLRIRRPDGIYKTECLDLSFSRVIAANFTNVIYEPPENDTVPPFMIHALVIPLSLEPTVKAKVENNSCVRVIALDPRGIVRLTPTNFSRDVEGNSYCRYNFFAPVDFKVNLACFAPRINVTDTEVMPCKDQFIVLAEGRKDSIHCSDTSFSRTSANTQMALLYFGFEKTPQVPFICDVYAEEKVVKNPPRNATKDKNLSFKTCDREIHLKTYDMLELKSPNFPGVEPEWSACRWKVTVPQDSRILLSCNRPGYRRTVKRSEPCSAFLDITQIGRPKLTYCRETPFLTLSTSYVMMIEFKNQLADTVESFKCILATELKWPWESCVNCNVDEIRALRKGPYGWCDYSFNLKSNEMAEIKFPDEFALGENCRWTVVAPMDSRVFLSCPLKNDLIKYPCLRNFTVHSSGNTTDLCRGKDSNLYSVTNWMTITMKIPLVGENTPFVCFAYVEKNEAGCENCTGDEFDGWSEVIELHENSTTTQLLSPNYPFAMETGVPYRWVLKSPPRTSIAISCPNTHDDPTKKYRNCWGFFTVYDPKTKTKTSYCRHAAWGTKSTSNELVMNYKNDIGLSRHPFKCYATVVQDSCSGSMQSLSLNYDQHVTLPLWDVAQNPRRLCRWSITAPPDMKINIVCNDFPKAIKGTLLISKTGDITFSNGLRRDLGKPLSEVSEKNRMTVEYDISAVIQRDEYKGCWVFTKPKPIPGDECNCGNYNAPPTRQPYSRMMNSVASPENAFPMIAAIADTLSQKFFCGATVISEHHALSSATCYNEVKKFYFSARLFIGGHKIAYGGYRSYYVIDKWITHPNFKFTEPYKDEIAICYVGQKIEFSQKVRPVCLPYQYQYSQPQFLHELVTAIGWGDIMEKSFVASFYQIRPDYLLQATGTVVPGSECRSSFRLFSDYRHICIKYKKETTCMGDHGGPILWQDPQTGRLNLIGNIVAEEKHCTGPPFVSYAIRIMPYLDWIRKTLPSIKFCNAPKRKP